jgi:signal transduction histidine kinase
VVIEAFSNILHHARATTVTVRMRCTEQSFTLEIRDDGVGFDASRSTNTGRGGRRAQGLANIRRRAELLDAELTIESAAGRGTTLSLTMPVATTRRHP